MTRRIDKDRRRSIMKRKLKKIDESFKNDETRLNLKKKIDKN